MRQVTSFLAPRGAQQCDTIMASLQLVAKVLHAAAPAAAAIALLALLAAGCATYRAAPLELRRSADEFAARRLDSPALRARVSRLLPQAGGSWPPRVWDRAELLAVALAQNPDLKFAHAEALAVRAREIRAAELPNPDLLLRSEYARDDMHPWLYGISSTWLIRNGERRRLDQRIARLNSQNARLRLMDRIWGVRRALVAALSDSESARRGLHILGRLRTTENRLLSLQRRRVDAGEDPPGELVSAQQMQSEIEQQQVRLRATADSADAAVAKALGLPAQALAGAGVYWPEWGNPPPLADRKLDADREQALLSRADLGIAIGSYAIAEARLERAVARQNPELSLGPGYYWDHGIAKFPFDVSLTLPMNRNRGEIAAAQADRAAVGARMLALQAGIYGQIAAARRAERTARAGLLTAQRRLAAARRERRQTDLAVRVGEIGLQRRLAVDMRVARTELDLLQVRAQLQGARNTLEDVLRMPLSGPELKMTTTMPAPPRPRAADLAGS